MYFQCLFWIQGCANVPQGIYMYSPQDACVQVACIQCRIHASITGCMHSPQDSWHVFTTGFMYSWCMYPPKDACIHIRASCAFNTHILFWLIQVVPSQIAPRVLLFCWPLAVTSHWQKLAPGFFDAPGAESALCVTFHLDWLSPGFLCPGRVQQFQAWSIGA